jgi:hypothetical protein
MRDSYIHYSSYSRGWRPLCGAPSVPEAVRGTFAVRDVTCPKCIDAMSEEGSGRDAATSPQPGLGSSPT